MPHRLQAWTHSILSSVRLARRVMLEAKLCSLNVRRAVKRAGGPTLELTAMREYAVESPNCHGPLASSFSWRRMRCRAFSPDSPRRFQSDGYSTPPQWTRRLNV